jgi:hypothetical protein
MVAASISILGINVFLMYLAYRAVKNPPYIPPSVTQEEQQIIQIQASTQRVVQKTPVAENRFAVLTLDINNSGNENTFVKMFNILPHFKTAITAVIVVLLYETEILQMSLVIIVNFSFFIFTLCMTPFSSKIDNIVEIVG